MFHRLFSLPVYCNQNKVPLLKKMKLHDISLIKYFLAKCINDCPRIDAITTKKLLKLVAIYQEIDLDPDNSTKPTEDPSKTLKR